MLIVDSLFDIARLLVWMSDHNNPAFVIQLVQECSGGELYPTVLTRSHSATSLDVSCLLAFPDLRQHKPRQATHKLSSTATKVASQIIGTWRHEGCQASFVCGDKKLEIIQKPWTGDGPKHRQHICVMEYHGAIKKNAWDLHTATEDSWLCMAPLSNLLFLSPAPGPGIKPHIRFPRIMAMQMWTMQRLIMLTEASYYPKEKEKEANGLVKQHQMQNIIP